MKTAWQSLGAAVVVLASVCTLALAEENGRQGAEQAPAREAPPESAPARAEKPAAKGMELYSWQDEKNQWRFSLVRGTNRQKTIDLVQAQPLDFAQLKKELAHLAKGEYVFWHTFSHQRTPEGRLQPVPLPLPPQETVREVRELCGKLELELSVLGGGNAEGGRAENK